jgi:hypothetical protein
VLDGGSGSNFLTGGADSGSRDTFFIDARPDAPGPSGADTWSTINNFHAGDMVTVWGLTPQDFALQWVDGQGIGAYTGITLHAVAPNRPSASVTLAGYSSADFSSGRLTIAFGNVNDTPCMLIQASG